jgi:hypothetical protein
VPFETILHVTTMDTQPSYVADNKKDLTEVDAQPAFHCLVYDMDLL